MLSVAHRPVLFGAAVVLAALLSVCRQASGLDGTVLVTLNDLNRGYGGFGVGDIVLIDAASGSTTTVGNGAGPCFSPDGTQIAYWLGGKVYTMANDGTGVTEICSTYNTQVAGQAMNWTTTGYLYWTEQDSRFYRANIATGQKEIVATFSGNIPTGDSYAIYAGSVSLDGKRAGGTMMRWYVYGFDLVAGTEFNLGEGCRGTISPNGEYITHNIGSHVECDIHRFSDGSVYTTITAPPGGFNQHRFSHSSNDYVVYVKDRTLDAYVHHIHTNTYYAMGSGSGHPWDFWVGALPGPAQADNYRPSVNAGPDRTITLPDDTVDLDGTVTDDGRPDPPGGLTTTWSKVSGPGTVTFGDAGAVDTSAAFGAEGAYVLKLTADDGELSASDEVTVTLYPEGGGTVLKINVGPDGGSVPGWVDDDPYRSGGTDYYGWIGYPVDLNGQSDPAPEAVYTTIVHRSSSTDTDHSFAIPVPNDTYRVRMHFYDGFDTYQRSMDFTFEGQLLLDDIDILTEAGGKQKALIKDVTVEVTDGVLNIECSSSRDVFESGIEVIALGSGGSDVAIHSFTASPSTVTQGQSATLSWSTSNASSVTIDQGIGDVSADGTRDVSPGSTTTYTLTAQGQGGPKTMQATVTVTATQPTVITSPAASGREFTEGDFVIFEGTGTNLVWTYDIDTDAQGPQEFGTGTVGMLTMPTDLPSLPATLTVTLAGDVGTDSQTHSIISFTQPTIRVTWPNGGEIVYPGQVCLIRWESQAVTDVSIFYSPNGGMDWEMVESDLWCTDPQWAAYVWTVPETISSQCLFCVADYAGWPSDDSDGVFEISPDDDDDGLPDSWEIMYFGDTLGDPDADYDMDGYPNSAEYLGGSDPTDPASVPPGQGTDGGSVGFGCSSGAPGSTRSPGGQVALVAFLAAVLLLRRAGLVITRGH